MNTLKKWFIFLMASCMLGLTASANATEAPDALVKRISKEVMDAAKANKEIKAADSVAAVQSVEVTYAV